MNFNSMRAAAETDGTVGKLKSVLSASKIFVDELVQPCLI